MLNLSFFSEKIKKNWIYLHKKDKSQYGLERILWLNSVAQEPEDKKEEAELYRNHIRD